jgi:hypothetical protein
MPGLVKIAIQCMVRDIIWTGSWPARMYAFGQWEGVVVKSLAWRKWMWWSSLEIIWPFAGVCDEVASTLARRDDVGAPGYDPG